MGCIQVLAAMLAFSSVHAGLPSGPVISEFMADNEAGLRDDFGDCSDWIEVFNNSTGAVNLAGWHLTDNAGSPTKFTFPSPTWLGPGSFLIVFASGRTNGVPGGALHAPFKLDDDGEYLGLLRPDLGVAHAFAPAFPEQHEDYSFGFAQATPEWLAQEAEAAWRVPAAGDHDTAWITNGFDDSAWARGPAGLGLGGGAGNLMACLYRATGVSLTTLAGAESVLTNPATWMLVTTGFPQTINFWGSGGTGNYGSDSPFPGLVAGQAVNQIVLLANGRVYIPSAGPWTFGVNSDDGFGLSLSNAAGSFSLSYPSSRAAANSLGVFNVPSAGFYDLRLVFFQGGGGFSLEFFAAPGSLAAFNSSVFRLVGDVANGGLRVGSAAAQEVVTDVTAPMLHSNASLRARWQFAVTDLASVVGAQLDIKSEDGFAAWINGAEVARRRAPGALAWNAAATTNRPEAAIQEWEIISLTNGLASLGGGTNVLAIQALNDGASDPDFVIRPRLRGIGPLETNLFYLAAPSPGAPNRADTLGFVGKVTYSAPRGFYTNAFSLALATDPEEAEIRYTLDGSTPAPTNGAVYAAPLTIASTTVIRTRAFLAGYVPSACSTRTFLFPGDVIGQSPTGAAPGPGWPTSAINGQVVNYGMDPRIVTSASYAAVIGPALTDIPSLSLVTDFTNLFDAAGGIYVNASQDGAAWERPASLELLDPAGDAGFQINAGLRIRGHFSRSAANPKHAFRAFFRSDYGDSKLKYPLFGEEGVDSFDSIDIQTSQNYSWSFQGDSRNTMCREIFSRDTSRDMGQPYTRSRYYHLYLNGHYWGIYLTQERAEADYAASYFGGQDTDYDVIKCDDTTYAVYATDGGLDAYSNLWTIAVRGFTNEADYFLACGASTNGVRDPALPAYVDAANVADVMISAYHAGDLDNPISWFLGNNRPNNLFGIRPRDGSWGFRFFRYDAEHSLGAPTLTDLTLDRTGPWTDAALKTFTYFNHQWLHQQLCGSREYRTLFADRVYRHFSNSGVLTLEAASARFLSRADSIRTAIVAESARWGDAKTATPFTRDQHWIPQVNAVVSNWLPARTSIVLQQFRNRGWYPNFDPPAFSIGGGVISNGTPLLMTTPAGMGYYTLDGSDPRLAGGGIASNALAFPVTPGIATQELLSAGSAWRYLADGSDQGTAWTSNAFSDTTWSNGLAQLGYGDGDEATTIPYGTNANNKFITCYFRRSLVVSNAAHITALTVQLLRDDGAVVYCNGREVLRDNLPAGAITSLTRAVVSIGAPAESTFYPFDISPTNLLEGTNVIAVEIHQQAPTSTDVSFDLRLIAQRMTDVWAPLFLTNSALIRARVWNGTEWSALREGSYAVGSSVQFLRITEIMFNPPAGGPTNFAAGDYEFVEVLNTGSGPLDLDGVRFTRGLSYAFPPFTLGAGQRVAVVRNPAAFASRYDTNGIAWTGPFTGSLNNAGDTIELQDRFATVIQSFRFDNEWSAEADGGGRALVMRSPQAETIAWSFATNWSAGTVHYGTPGQPEPTLAPGAVIINEILTHTDADEDWIELRNTTATNIDIGGWLLSDRPAGLAQYVIPAGTVLTAGACRVFLATQDFDNASNPACLTPFALSELGETLVVSEGAAGRPGPYRQHLEFEAAAREVTFGTYVRSDGQVEFTALRSATRGGSNDCPLVGPVVIREIMYHPLTIGDEFIELENIATNAVGLFDPLAPGNTWRLAGAVAFAFPTNLSLPPGGRLVVVADDPAAFRARNAIDAAVPVLGPWTGALDNAGESVRLQKPGDAEVGGFVPCYTVDHVHYNDTASWPPAADGTGPSLERLHRDEYGNDPANWRASVNLFGTPGEVTQSDDDGDGLPDNWAACAFSNAPPGATQGDADYDADRLSNSDEYLWGTEPTNALSGPAFALELIDGAPALRFQTQVAAGPGYIGLQRRYDIEAASVIGSWSNLPGYVGIPADGTDLIVTNPPADAALFRVRVRIEP